MSSTAVYSVSDITRSRTINDTEQEAQSRLSANRAAAGAPREPLPHYAQPPSAQGSWRERWKTQGGLLGILASLVALAAKLKFVALALLKLKFLLSLGSLLLSMWAWGAIYGWKFGVGLALLIFLHECGHVVAFRLRGIPVTGMVFIPFLGAYVTGKRGGQNAAENAFIGIMGPVFGALAGLGCLLIYAVSPSHFWVALAQWSFIINLFNLLPIPTLDGSRLLPLFSRENGVYTEATAADRWKYGAAYLSLALFLSVVGFGLRFFLSLPASG